MTLSSLIERLEKAEGPDRELDEELALISGCERKDHWWKVNGAWGLALPAFTSSVDAALTLVPEGFKWKAGYSRYVPHNAGIQDYRANPVLGVFVGECDSNRAIALCIAVLRARSAMTEPRP